MRHNAPTATAVCDIADGSQRPVEGEFDDGCPHEVSFWSVFVQQPSERPASAHMHLVPVCSTL
jgi:hypothetical protein